MTLSDFDLNRLHNTLTEVVRLRTENDILKKQIETMAEPQDLPLWRRITNQRREIKAAWAYAEMYRRWWRKERDALEVLKRQTTN